MSSPIITEVVRLKYSRKAGNIGNEVWLFQTSYINKGQIND